MINVFQPSLGTEETEAVGRVFDSNWLGKGKLTAAFEQAFAAHLQVASRQVRSASCCTEGLFQAIRALGIGAGDEVVMPSISFVGAANAVVDSGATLVFCDSDPRTLNPTAEMVAACITARTRAILILHYGGLFLELGEIAQLAREKNVILIEDAACSVASRIDAKALGTFGDVGVWSFDAMKILVTGDGAMVYCRDEELALRMERSMYLGMATASGFANAVAQKWWEFDVACAGRRAIMNDVASAIGLEQLRKLAPFIRRRRDVHEAYDRDLASVKGLTRPPGIAAGHESSYYFYWVQLEGDARDRLAIFLRERGVYTTFRYYPLHLVKFYGDSRKLTGAEEAARSTLCIPIHQGLTDADVDRVVDGILEFSRTL